MKARRRIASAVFAFLLALVIAATPGAAESDTSLSATKSEVEDLAEIARAAGIPIDIPRKAPVEVAFPRRSTTLDRVDGFHTLEVAGHHLVDTGGDGPEATPGPDAQATHAVGSSFVVTYSPGTPQAVKDAVEYATDIWARNLVSPVPITVDVNWANLGSPSLLGSAGPSFYWRDSGSTFPLPNVFYPDALANSLAGTDLDPTTPDIQVNLNSAFGTWYLGLDRQGPPGSYDLVTVMIHELGHGLGMAGSATVSGSTGIYGLGSPLSPIVYDTLVYDTVSGQDLLAIPNFSPQLATALTGGGLEHRSPRAFDGNDGMYPRLYAPAAWQGGSSYSHLDESTFPVGNPEALMTPFLDAAESEHEIGYSQFGIMEELGWQMVSPTSTRTISPSHRAADTRFGTGVAPGPLGPGESVEVQVVGVGGVPASDVTAVFVNITGLATAETNIRAYPDLTPVPPTSLLNLVAGETFANLAVVEVGSNGKIRLWNAAGQTHVIVDIMGFVVADGSFEDKGYSSMPVRIGDTRDGTGGVPVGKVGPGGSILIDAATYGGLPAGGDVKAVLVNVTSTGATAPSHFLAYEEGTVPPATSILNFTAGQTIPNLALVPVDQNGQFRVRNHSGQADIVVDLVGWFGRADSFGADFHSISSVRAVDTRFGTGGTALGPGATLTVQIAGLPGVPPSDIKTVYLNVTALASSPTFVTAYPSGGPPPPTSNLNLVGGEIFPNMVAVAVGDDGKIVLRNDSGSTDLIVDVFGYDRR